MSKEQKKEQEGKEILKAKKLFKMKLSMEKIVEATDLSVDEVENLKEKL